MTAPMPPARTARLVEMGPVLAALAVHAAAHARWWLAGPAAVAVVGAALRRPRWTGRPGALAVAAVGALAGVVLSAVSPAPDSALPPALVSALTCGLIALALWHVAAGRGEAAWASAWALAALSVRLSTPPALQASLAALGVTTALALAARSGAWRSGAVGLAATAGLFTLTAAGALGLATLVRASERALLSAAAALVGPGATPRPELSVARSQRQGLDGTALYELDAPVPRLRTLLFDDFDGARWTTSEGLAAQAGLLSGGGERHATIWVLTGGEARVPVPEGLTAVGGAAVVVHAGQLVTAKDVAGRRLTLSWSDAQPPSDPPGPGTLALPEALRAELEPLAQGLLGTPPGRARADAEALAHHLSERHEYTLDVDLQGPGHPLAVLVAERRPAFCAYFASAMAALLRTRGVHARVVGGYAGGAVNPLTGRMVLRARDAHAWVEAWLPDEAQWATFDPTPWRSRDALEGRGPPSRLSQLADAVASAARRALALARHRPREALASAASSPVTWLAAGLAGAAGLWRRWSRRRRPAREATVAPPADAALARARARFEALLARCGVVARPTQTEGELLAKLSETAPRELVAPAADFVRAYQGERFRARTGRALEGPLDALERAVSARARP
ncbi:MAG: transglutaminase domain-containing protein [Myxococcaceae bacterium]|nr:transglutaminase domain-containing protein [Myxococcaceae bacterium]MCA3013193.1 transglutaminase domain-containing protein [Myxococcaceae bacterium]